MDKKIFILIMAMVILIIGIEFFNISRNKKYIKEEPNNIIESETQIVNQNIYDECIHEWEDYRLSNEEETEEASKNINDDNRHYILKEKNGFINVYYIDEKEGEILYKVTDSYTKYLCSEDIEQLRKGIEVIGGEELNKILEDFE